MKSAKGKGYYYADGLRDGTPIGLAYFAVSFGVGILARAKGIPALLVLLMSATNLTSAGQAAGIEVIFQRLTGVGGAVGFTLALAGEVAVTQFVINLRYALMGISLSQKFSPRFGIGQRLAASAFITDEIFAVATSRDGEIEPPYWYGLATAPYFAWAIGTFCGALAGDILPAALTDALGIALYGMFIAIIIPPARDNRGVLCGVLLAAATSCLCYFLPCMAFLSSGFRVIVCAILSAAVTAAIFPVKPEEGGDAA